MPIIYLIGPRASGKTTIGGLLAYHLDYEFRDLDQCIKEARQQTVTEIVAEGGWETFRSIESETLRRVAGSCKLPTVVATGGGIVLDPANRQFMMETGQVIWIRTEEEELVRRLAKNPEAAQRPSLTGGALVAEVQQVLASREPLYAACAHHIVNGCESPKMICDQISATLGIPLGDS